MTNNLISFAYIFNRCSTFFGSPKRFGIVLTICLLSNLAQASVFGPINYENAYQVNDPQLNAFAHNVPLLSRSKTAEKSFCSGLVFNKKGSYYLLTAAHCLRTQEECDKTYTIFDYTDKKLKKETLPYLKCSKIIYSSKSNQPDISISKLDVEYWMGYWPSIKERRLKELDSFELNIQQARRLDPIAIIGYPWASTIKTSRDSDCKIVDNRDDVQAFFEEDKYKSFEYQISHKGFRIFHTCDTRSGNSGSPVFSFINDQWALSGVLSGGPINFTDNMNRLRGIEKGEKNINHDSNQNKKRGSLNFMTDMDAFKGLIPSFDTPLSKDHLFISFDRSTIVDMNGLSFLCHPSSEIQYDNMDNTENEDYIKKCLHYRDLFLLSLKELNINYRQLKGSPHFVSLNNSNLDTTGDYDDLGFEVSPNLTYSQQKDHFKKHIQLRMHVLKNFPKYKHQINYISNFGIKFIDYDRTLRMAFQAFAKHIKPAKDFTPYFIKQELKISSTCKKERFSLNSKICIQTNWDQNKINQTIGETLR